MNNAPIDAVNLGRISKSATLRVVSVRRLCVVASFLCTLAFGETTYLSRAPMRPLPEVSRRTMPAGAVSYVDAAKGDDSAAGSKDKPWKTLKFACRQLKPGDTLCLRGGIYYENAVVSAQGTAEKPITIRSQQGELAIIDAGYREFFEDPAHAWEPYPQGAPGEYRSTKSYTTGGGFGNFGDSMIPFHRYMNFADLRATSEYWRTELENRADGPDGIYAGPGTHRNPETGRIHIRLAPTLLPGLGDNAYKGETDPRKIPLVIAGDGYALAIEKAQHVRLQDLVLRGAKTGAVKIESAEDIVFDGVTLYAGNLGMRITGARGMRMVDCALRGYSAPWHSRFHHKSRAGSGYLIVTEGPCTDFEFAHCELTDHHDFFTFRNVEEMRFHECFVDNFNDDGFEPGPKRERGHIFIYQNLISRLLSPFTLEGKKPNPVVSEPGSGIYVYRNIVDLRRGTYKTPPGAADPSGAYLHHPADTLDHDHGSPIHPVAYVYQNTFLLATGVTRDYYAASWGAHAAGTTRRVFNNIFVQIEGVPGLNLAGLSPDDDFQADGNLYWGVRDGAAHVSDFFGKFRQSPIVAASKTRYAPGLGAGDRFGDPRFISLDLEGKKPLDARLGADSPGTAGGVVLPQEWPDPLRPANGARPDIGALPRGVAPWSVGVRGRIPLATESK